MDFDSTLSFEGFEADAQALFQSTAAFDDDITEYQKEAIQIGKEIIALYIIDDQPILKVRSKMC